MAEIATKQELFDDIKKKNEKLTQADFDKAWVEQEAEMKRRLAAMNVTDAQQILTATIRKMQLYFKKAKTLNVGEEVEIVPIGLDRITDYGAKNKYDAAVRLFKTDPEKATMEGVCNAQGVPVWESTHKYKKGKPIVPEQEKSRMLICFAKRKTDAAPKLGVMSLKGNNLNAKIVMGKKYKTNATIANATFDKWQNQRIIMYSNDGTTFEEAQTIELSIPQMIEKFAKNDVIDLQMVRTKASESAQFNIFKGDVVRTKEGNPGMSNVMFITDHTQDDSVVCWVPEDLPLNVVDNAMDVYFVGRGQVRQDKQTNEDRFSINLMGFHPSNPLDLKNDQETKTIPTPPPQTERVVQEETITDVPPQVEGW